MTWGFASGQDNAPAPEDDRIIIAPLFDYPVVPEEIEGLQNKSDYLIEHFWDSMDFKSTKAVDQNALNHAFATWTSPMRFATAGAVDASVAKLTENLSKNPVLTLQFAKAAEEALYGLRADYWNDDLFLIFVENVLKNKGIKKEKKEKYETFKKLLTNSRQGSVPPEFDYVTPEGKKSHYHPNGVITVLLIGEPSDSDTRFIKLKLETDVKFSGLVEKGKINVLYITPDISQGWEDKMKGYNAKWYAGAAEQLRQLYDLRMQPAIYVIDREGKIAVKNVTVSTAIQVASAAAEQ